MDQKIFDQLTPCFLESWIQWLLMVVYTHLPVAISKNTTIKFGIERRDSAQVLLACMDSLGSLLEIYVFKSVHTRLSNLPLHLLPTIVLEGIIARHRLPQGTTSGLAICRRTLDLICALSRDVAKVWPTAVDLGTSMVKMMEWPLEYLIGVTLPC
jgi:hypothetical protein